MPWARTSSPALPTRPRSQSRSASPRIRCERWEKRRRDPRAGQTYREAHTTVGWTPATSARPFGDLDAVAGDGDFGYSLARGFEIVLADWDTLAADSPAEFLKKVALVISKRVGGTSGPLWGTAFLWASGAVKDRPELDSADAVAMLRAAAEGIKARGKSDLGDKTLLDALIPMPWNSGWPGAGATEPASVRRSCAASSRSTSPCTTATCTGCPRRSRRNWS
ncbi:DAK2 domain-containing protein [Streptomyces sp. NPDC059697]|uniref:DAK2 domain-containing protein n=1 Tax=Streptomyces sp. NPDC059697 TaxID=3346912 RepID=UPI00367D28AA